jgi:hypothetical protein
MGLYDAQIEGYALLDGMFFGRQLWVQCGAPDEII